MISLDDVSHVLVAITPLYVAMFLAYASLKWWKLFTQEQCDGINKFVANVSIPLMTFQIISTSNPYNINFKLIISDVLQKAFALIIMVVITKLSGRGGGLRWITAGFCIVTLPNTLIVGIPLMTPIYGKDAPSLLAQIILMQQCIWYNVMLFVYELSAAREEASIASSILPATTEDTEASHEGTQAHKKENTLARKSLAIAKTVGKKLIVIPNTHATVLGLVWALVHFRWDIKLPIVVDDSIKILGVGGLGMAMFSIGLFMASRPKIISCGVKLALLTMGMRFLLGPALMVISSLAIGLRGTLLRVAIVQASIPLGIVPFVYAKEYNMYPDIFSTGVIFGLIIAVPVALGYYFLVGL